MAGAPHSCNTKKANAVIIAIGLEHQIGCCVNALGARLTGTAALNVSSKVPTRLSLGHRLLRYLMWTGQTASWKAHHRHLCKLVNHFIVSEAWQALDPHRRTDSILLSHIAVPWSTSYNEVEDAEPGTRDLGLIAVTPFTTSFDLIRGPYEPLPYMILPGKGDNGEMWSSWFGPNNFLLHSHLNPAYAHGAYILASRTLNHSCVPNAAPKFVLSEGKTPRMDVMAITSIKKGDEVSG